MKINDISTIGISAALLFVLGYVAFFASHALIIPGSKFLIMAPLLSMTLYFPLNKRPKGTTLIYTNAVFALLLIYMSLWMALAILMTSMVCSIVFSMVNLITTRKTAISFALSLYPAVAMLISVFISIHITGLNIYGESMGMGLVLASCICFALGFGGVKLAYLIQSRTGKQIGEYK